LNKVNGEVTRWKGRAGGKSVCRKRGKSEIIALEKDNTNTLRSIIGILAESPLEVWYGV
jgi:hypothetical protein